MFKLYADNQLIGIYETRLLATLDAFELMLDGVFQEFKIIQN